MTTSTEVYTARFVGSVRCDTETGARGYGAGAGTSTSALMFGGREQRVTGKTETWNGTNWTETTDLNQARESGDGAGAVSYKTLRGNETVLDRVCRLLLEKKTTRQR